MKPMKSSAAAWGLTLALAAGGAGTAGAGDAAPAQPMIGDEAPAFALKTVAGDTMSLRDLRGTMLVIHFGTSW